MTAAAASKPWYREPMVWLAMVIPLATIPAGLATWWIAAQGPSATATADDSVRRVGQVQVVDLEPDLAAARLGLRAGGTLLADRTRIEVLLAVDVPGSALTLELRHPADAGLDQTVALESLGNRRFVAHVRPLAGNAWNLRLVSDGGWRLNGRLAADASAFELVPAVEAG
jgi:hypothetical protein